MSDLSQATARALAGGPERHREKAAEQGKLPVRERVALLLDTPQGGTPHDGAHPKGHRQTGEGSFSEEALLANWNEDGLGADGVVTGIGEIDGRPVA
ncbi:MAG TPA: hypothetical protein VFR48_07830, partial [Solirubrobacteraceae bacterium]|nr:hypothetical protein [Solirubrobacteraceae bacterium]